jgi:hypothetical protein
MDERFLHADVNCFLGKNLEQAIRKVERLVLLSEIHLRACEQIEGSA